MITVVLNANANLYFLLNFPITKFISKLEKHKTSDDNHQTKQQSSHGIKLPIDQ